MDRASFDQAVEQPERPYRIVDRISGHDISLSQHDFDDLCRVHLVDWLEQVPQLPGMGLSPGRLSQDGRALGKSAAADFDRVYSQAETAKS